MNLLKFYLLEQLNLFKILNFQYFLNPKILFFYQMKMKLDIIIIIHKIYCILYLHVCQFKYFNFIIF